MKKSLALLGFLIVTASTAWAEYYTILERKTASDTPEIEQEIEIDPASVFQEISKKGVKIVLDLMSWQHHSDAMEVPASPYKRLQHFGTWIRDRAHGSCLNTRAQILRDTSQTPVHFRSSGCTIESGEWYDNYTGQTYTDATDIQIDHMVPLKNAYMTGAWKWDYQKRCLYGNFRGNDFHLIPANRSANARKGDRSPADYMPPNKAYTCTYLSNWLKIKLIWNLTMTEEEGTAIERLVIENGCHEDELAFTSRDLAKQRQKILDQAQLCN